MKATKGRQESLCRRVFNTVILLAFSILATAFFCVPSFAEEAEDGLVTAQEVVDSGQCGDNMYWELTGSGSNLTLTLSGSGDMYYYDGDTLLPWANRRAKIKKAIVKEGVTDLEYATFYNCKNLTDVQLPDSLRVIGGSAFYGCSKLTSIEIPDNVVSIRHDAFVNCTNLSDVILPDNLTELGSWAFSGCKNLTSISIPSKVVWLEGAFSGCTNLTYVEMPETVYNMDYAFKNCSNLTSITIPDGVEGFEHTFYGCSNLTSVKIPDSVTSIGWEAFKGCRSLKSINIPDSVVEIDPEAFWGCVKMRSIFIPDSVDTIGYNAFGGHPGICAHIILDYDDRGFTPGGIVYINYQGTKAEWNSLGYEKEPGQVLYCNVSSFKNMKSPKDVTIYRLYNRKTKEHLWTSSLNEYNTLPSYGWTKEGVAWKAPGKGTGVYRLYNPKTKDHHYTSSTNERKVLTTRYGWRYDNNGKPVFYSGGIREVGRLYNSSLRIGSHHFTVSTNEYDKLPELSYRAWEQEDVAFYCVQ